MADYKKYIDTIVNEIMSEFNEMFAPSTRINISYSSWKENNDSYSIKIEIPGFNSRHISIEIKDNRINIFAENDNQALNKSLPLPLYKADYVNAIARCKDGILTITIPKTNAIVNNISIPVVEE